MFRLRNPAWINTAVLENKSLDQYSDPLFIEVNSRLHKIRTDNPVVSIVIIAYNEEANIVRCIDSLSKISSRYPFEIIIVDNNSKDRTAEAIKKFNVTYLFQAVQGCGVARQLGMEHAKGKYILTGDADTLYPPDWVNELTQKLEMPNIACVFGRYSFIANEDIPRWKLTIYETLSDLLVFAKNYKRPFLNVLGMTMGFVKEYGLKVGYVELNIRGEDGRLAFDLMKYGKIKGIFSDKSRVWTGVRTLAKDGNLFNAILIRFHSAISNIGSYMTKHKDHDTKSSKNSDPKTIQN
jgi:glycosyltransferase involved in cell wall biosynthesis